MDAKHGTYSGTDESRKFGGGGRAGLDGGIDTVKVVSCPGVL